MTEDEDRTQVDPDRGESGGDPRAEGTRKGQGPEYCDPPSTVRVETETCDLRLEDLTTRVERVKTRRSWSMSLGP